ncbi:MAG TPA: hypothetical protein VG962_13740 [Steroidobacteraceae bacterium]|nr:hypothetical protein [Steroidobacteraceae bacterium]
MLCTLGDYGYGSPDSGSADCSVWQRAVCVTTLLNRSRYPAQRHICSTLVVLW